MAEARSVSVVVKADIQDYVTKMGQASKATKDFASQTGKVSGSASTSTKNLGTAAKSASGDLDKAAKSAKGFGDAAGKVSEGTAKAAKATDATGASAKRLGLEMAVAGVAVAAGIGLAVKAFADFDKEMSGVRAVSGATAGEMNQLTAAALDAGAATKFSAAEAATAEAELVKAGISTVDVLGGALTGALSLAAAGNLDLATAATISANAMNIFSLKGEDVGHIADVLAAGANKSAADVNQLGQALEQSGLVAAQMGLSLEDTTGVLAAFADNGLKGSDAGTSFKTMLQRLVPSSVAAAEAMEDIGFSAYDAQGNLKSIDAVAQNLQDSLSGLTQKQKDQTLATIFGSDAVRGANVLFKLGAKGVQDYTKAVNDNGAASRVAAIQMDNLAGDLENLKGSIETALIKSGSQANGVLRDLAYLATQAVNGLSGLPEPVQKAGIGLGAIASSVLLVGGGLVSVLPKIAATKTALTDMGISLKAVSAFAGPVGIALGVAALAAGLYASSQLEAKQRADDLRDSLDQQTGAITDNTKGLVAARLQVERFTDASGEMTSILDVAKATGVALADVTDGALGDPTAIDRINKAYGRTKVELEGLQRAAAAGKDVDFTRLQFLEQQVVGYEAVRDAIGETADVLNPQITKTQQYAEAVGKTGTESKTAADKGRLLKDEIEDQQKVVKDAQKAYDDLTKAVKGYGDQVDASRSATAGYEQSVDDFADLAKNRAEAQAAIAKFDADAAEDRKRLTAELAKATTPEDKARIKGELSKVGDPAERQRLVDSAAKFAKTLDLGTEAGRRNDAMLRELASTAKGAAVENFKAGDGIGIVQKRMEGARATFIKQAEDFGYNKKEAEAYADQLGLTRQNVERLGNLPPAIVSVDANTEPADTKILKTQGLLSQMAGTKSTALVDANNIAANAKITETDGLLDLIDGKLVVANIQIKTTVEAALTATVDEQVAALSGTLSQQPIKRAAGGPVMGAGSATSDSIPAYLSNGEYVIKAAAVSRYGSHFFDRLNTMRFADGGLVARAMSSSTVNSGGNVTNDRRINIENVNAADFASFEREADRRSRLHALGRRGSG